VLHRESADQPAWGFTEELLAQLIEEVSVLAADHRREKPRDVFRPYLTVDEKQIQALPDTAQDDARRRGPNDGLTQLLAAAAAQQGLGR
jgi:hypothetical protein